MPESKQTLIERLRKAADTDKAITLTGKEADVIADLFDIIRQAKYDASAALMLANTACLRFRE